jgi:hypothetical protein
MSRWRRVVVFCGFAAVLGIVLAYRDRAGRESARADSGPDPAVRAAQGQPWPEPKHEDVLSALPVGEQPKRADAVLPKAEPKPQPEPQPEPPPVDPTPARKAAYVRIVAALEGAEAAAVKKYGRKPQPDDTAGFTIPYKAFVNTQAQLARKRLAKELGLSEREIDQIKAEGDKAGWPRE